ncbi:hypothetical protein BaRGS_00012702 [Batillaria attramentaria]|uniref:Extradiol ring-cleavage dioxygenase class III enzyme subunit B domain-containing protein n=1 Tax=Batillaria attramentaria TaxID=370345 RepID=A0ABD0L8W8_9CAEN
MRVLRVLLFLQLPHVFAKIMGNFVMPHGGIALDPNHFNTTNATAKAEAWEINRACVEVGKEIQLLQPDLVFLSTPHGIADLRNFLFYLNPFGQGYADTDNCQCPPCCYKVSAKFDAALSKRLVNTFGIQKNVSGLSAYGPPGQSSEPFPLRWGEVIPLHFIPDLNKTKVVILSQPSRRYTEDVSMIPELLKLGSSLWGILEELSERVVIIISADLAHTHLASGPYGYSNASEPFDEACGQWAMDIHKEALLVTAAHYVDRALSCGYTGLVMLHGLLTADDQTAAQWQPRLLANHHPSYYGMMVASFIRKQFHADDV